MVSIWWILFAVLIGAYAGAVLVGLMAVSARSDEEHAVEIEDEDVRLVA